VSLKKILSLRGAVAWRRRARRSGRKVVFTNGCFDILHAGHVGFLEAARRLGDLLIVGLNTDRSVRRLKGKGRPVQTEGDRARILAALEAVDAVVLFGEDTPARIIDALVPDVLAKGADWGKEEIVGRDTVVGAGGKVVRIRLRPGASTSGLLRRIVKAAGRSGRLA
jgi:rfaE bifunctional protein nucleotidyltransferase chain/domain